MLRYKIREEKEGAMLFDNYKGEVKALDEQKYKAITEKYGKSLRIFKTKNRKSLPNNCFSAPSKVYFELTRKCNLRCKMCYNKSGESLQNELSKSKIFDVLKDLEKAGTFEIRFTGGEPTQRKDFFDIVEYAKKLGFFISIGTNGVWDKKTLKKIAKSSIDMIIISLEGPKKINDDIRGKGSLKKAVDSLAYLSKNTNKKLRINTTIAKYNVELIEYIVKLADRYKIPVINIMPIRLNGRSTCFLNDQTLTPEEYYEFIKNVEELRKSCSVKIQTYFDVLGERSRWLENQTSLLNKRTCAAGVEACVISPEGYVYGCAASNPIEDGLSKKTNNFFIVGNINERSIMDIWLDSEKWRVYRSFNLNKSKRCLKCNFYTKKCFGNCFVSSFFDSGKLNSDDPYCFAHLLKNSGVEKNG